MMTMMKELTMLIAIVTLILTIILAGMNRLDQISDRVAKLEREFIIFKTLLEAENKRPEE